MAGEIQAAFNSAGANIYAFIRNSVGQIANVSTLAFEAYNSANYANYVVSLTYQGVGAKYFIGDMPTWIGPGIYNFQAQLQAGGSPATTDVTIGVGDIQWNGSATLPLANLATSGQVAQFAPLRVARGTMVPFFYFNLVSSSDHITPFTSGICSGQICRDNGSFTTLQSGAFTEKGNGWYVVQALTSGDLLCNTAALMFTATGVSGGTSDPRNFGLVTQRTSGQ